MRVYMTFCREPNTAYFTNVSFVKEDAQSYKYNTDGELVSVTSSDNAEQSFSYSGADLISQVTKGNGSFSYEYDDAHNVTSVTNDGVSMSVSYDGKGNTTGTVLTGDGTSQKISSSAGYDSTGNRVTSQTDARGKTVSYSYDNVMNKQTGQPSSITDANNNTVFNFYNNSNGRITNTSLGYDVHLDYVYSGGQLASMSRGGYIPGNTTEQTQVYTMSYNGFGNMTGVSVGSRNLASYTYGPIMGLFGFAIIVRRPVHDRFVPLVALLAPCICLVLDLNSERWLGGYKFSYELLILNAFLTFAGMCCLIRRMPKQAA